MNQEVHPLLALAKQGASQAYAPYSKFQVGAGLKTKDGQTFLGCNVENVSYGLGLCAERNAITTAVANGAKPGDLVELVIFVDGEELISPCGACRQVISEFMKQDAPVSTFNNKGVQKTWTVAELLPDGFVLP
jgi:cytidine deaminase